MYELPAAFLVVPLVGLAIIVDGRTGRGYALGILSFLFLACMLLLAVAVTLVEGQPQPESVRGFGEHVLGIFNNLPTTYLTLTVVLAAVVVAGIVGQRRWLVGLVVATLIPAVATFLPLPVWYINTNLAVRSLGYIGFILNPVGTVLLAVPQVATLAYSVMRIRHPVAYVPARQPVPSESR